MDDKELDAMFKCHEALKDLGNDSKTRIFHYLSDRYKIEAGNSKLKNVPAGGAESPQPETPERSSSKSKNTSKKKSRRNLYFAGSV